MFTATWWGIGQNYGSLRLEGDSTRYVVDWGDGTKEVIRTDRDDDGDDYYTTEYGHLYASDGTYDVAVLQSQSGLPPVRLKAFMYARETDNITIGGTNLDDIIFGGSGDDVLDGARGRDTINGGDGNDTIRGGLGDEFLLGGTGLDLIYGEAGDDLIGGEDGADHIWGGGGSDALYGDGGDDELEGGAGDDYLGGGAGVDRLFGGAGADTFMFAPVEGQGRDTDRDLVVDFARGTDHLAVWDWIDDGAEVSFIGDAAFSADGGAEIRTVAGNGGLLVYGDANGDGAFDFTFKVNNVTALDATDFYI